MYLLPNWVATNKYPAFFDTNSGTAIEQTALVYGAMQDLIKEYNTFADNVNKIIKDNEDLLTEDNECFKHYIQELVKNFMLCVDNQILRQNEKIQENEQYMVDNITQTTTDIINQKIANGEIVVATVYNEQTESMEIIGTGV